MTPNDIVNILQERGWTAEIINTSQVEDLVDINSQGLLKCVDGRLSDHTAMRGPKVLGGIYGIAAARGVLDEDGLHAILTEVKERGYTPSVHGDEFAHPSSMGCGFFALWARGELPGLVPPKYNSEKGRNTILNGGGIYETLLGRHSESKVMINLVPNTTLEPKEEQRFVVDAWITSVFGLDVPTYLTLAVETVERLNGPRVAYIISE